MKPKFKRGDNIRHIFRQDHGIVLADSSDEDDYCLVQWTALKYSALCHESCMALIIDVNQIWKQLNES